MWPNSHICSVAYPVLEAAGELKSWRADDAVALSPAVDALCELPKGAG